MAGYFLSIWIPLNDENWIPFIQSLVAPLEKITLPLEANPYKANKLN